VRVPRAIRGESYRSGLKTITGSVEDPAFAEEGGTLSRVVRLKRKAGSEEPARFQHSSEHDDIVAVVADHLLDERRQEMTARWYPSRRGNSPLGPSAKKRRDTTA
jgi:hypothetical protein